MANDVVDGFESLVAGQNSGSDPHDLAVTAYAKGVNVMVRGGRVHTRPRLVLDADFAYTVFQGAGIWSLNSGDKIVFVADGTVVVYNVNTGVTTSLGVLKNVTARCYFCQADKYMLIQDDTTALTVLYEDTLGVPQVYASSVTLPIGTIMAYAHGRVHMVPKVVPDTAENGKPYFISGDVALPNDPANLLQATETTYWNEGGAFGLPQEMGYISNIIAFRNAATGTGIGGLVVMARNGMSGFDMSLPRTSWKDTNLAQVLFSGPGVGCVGSNAATPVNDDIAYRSQDGLRFVRYTKSQVGGSSGALSNDPVSNVIRDLVINESSASLPYVSMVAYDNRLLFTANGTNTLFKSLVSCDLSPYLGISESQAISFDGIWTGLEIYQVLSCLRNNVPTAYVFSSGVKLYHFSEDVYYDNTDVKPVCRLYTRAMTCGPELRLAWKRLKKLELWVSGLRYNVPVTVYYRPRGYPYWATFGEFEFVVPAGGDAQFRHQIPIPYDKDPLEMVVDSGASDVSSSFQLCIEWRGHMQLDACRLICEGPMVEPVKFTCTDNADNDILETTTGWSELDDYAYDAED